MEEILDKDELLPKKEKENILGTEKIGKLLLKFSLPAIIGMLVNSIYNMVDRIFIGNAPNLSQGLNALTYAFPIMMIYLGIALMMGVGGSIMFAIKLGEGDKVMAEKILNNALGLTFIVNLLLSILGLIFIEPLMRLINTSPEAMPYALDYMRVILYGQPLLAISVWGNNFLRADGKPILAMVSVSMGAVINIIGDYIFIFVIPWGTFGAALATIIGQASGCFFVLILYLTGKSSFKLKLKYMIPKLKTSLTILSLGLPAFILQVSTSIVQIILNYSLSIYSQNPFAVGALGVANSFQTLILQPVNGLTQGFSPIIGYNKGAKKIDRVNRTFFLTVIIATCISIFGFLLAMIFPTTIVGIFDNGDKGAEFLAVGTDIFRKWFMLIFLAGPQIVISNFFIAIGRSKTSTFLTLMRQLILLVPLVLLLPLIFTANPVDAILYSCPITDAISFLLSLGFILQYFIANKKKNSEALLNNDITK